MIVLTAEKITQLIQRRPSNWDTLSANEFKQDIQLLQNTCKEYQTALKEIEKQLESGFSVQAFQDCKLIIMKALTNSN